MHRPHEKFVLWTPNCFLRSRPLYLAYGLSCDYALGPAYNILQVSSYSCRYRPSLSAAGTYTGSVSMSLFRSCRAASVQTRGFTSSSFLRVGPESPNYVEIPQSLQPDLGPKRRVKGTLPVPRELFPARRADKPSEEYLAAATTPPSKRGDIDTSDPHAEHIFRKREMAEMRRRNLRQGLVELHRRKQATEKAMEKRSREKGARQQQLMSQPEREDERLTRPSVPQAMIPKKTPVLPDPDRKERLEASRKRLEAIQAKKETRRRDSLHTLYMNARTFITTEEQLAAEIDRVFPEGNNAEWRSDEHGGGNIWNRGAPPAVQSLVNDVKKGESVRWDVIQGRLKKLGEEITGGKM